MLNHGTYGKTHKNFFRDFWHPSIAGFTIFSGLKILSGVINV